MRFPLRAIKVNRLAAGCAVTLCLLANAQSLSQGLPKSPLPSAVTAPASPSTHAASSPSSLLTEKSPESKIADIDLYQADMQKRLDATKASLVKVQNELKELNDRELVARQTTLDRQIFLQKQFDNLAQGVDTLKDLRRLNNKLIAVQKEKETWVAPQGTPPWPLSVADELSLALMQTKFQTEHLDQRISILNQQIEDHKKDRAKTEIELRQTSSKVDAQGILSTHSFETIKRKLDLLDQDLSNSLLDKESVTTEKLINTIRHSIQKKTWAYYDGRFVFTDEDLQRVQAELEKKIVALRAQEQQASIKINRTLDAAAAAKYKLDTLQATANASPESISLAKQAWRSTDMVAQAARLEREKYRALIELNSVLIQIWTIRHTLYNPDQSNIDFAVIKAGQLNLIRRLDQGMQYLTQLIAEKSQSFFELNEQLAATKDPAEQAFLKSLLKPVEEEISNTREVYAEIGRARQLVLITDETISTKESKRSIQSILFAVKTATWSIAKDIWNFEIFAIDDVMLVDGREVKIKRSITIGKSIGALTILIVGFMLISRLIRRMLALAVHKANLGASKSVIIGRWLMLICGITLIVTAFNLVEIPLSAFAFFGGALAIGVGFGTQNLLKNLISGVMLLIEKPIRIGDLVEVDGITGTVTSIGIRFSTIHGAQGTDTLIPNSSLVEHKLVNWTYSTPDVRKDIRMTVAYNSNAKQVQELLMAISTAHPSVMRTPSPLVTLEDFGDNGLSFNLQCWMKVEVGLNVNQVLSELRLQILDVFSREGIEFPYPQRMIQFDQNTQLQVRIAPEHQ